ncbi:hypothetical protein AX14_010812 [Amanita brunnescens Koide BX004]|nr:hypothetical protein AX14_010812 [Amanita brunnescens Koide BX004]
MCHIYMGIQNREDTFFESPPISTQASFDSSSWWLPSFGLAEVEQISDTLQLDVMDNNSQLITFIQQ